MQLRRVAYAFYQLPKQCLCSPDLVKRSFPLLTHREHALTLW
jgi:hypothetical protein